jgi:SLT domain-containing protein
MSAAVKMGLPKEWTPLLSEIVKRESSFDPTAKNPTSSAYGYGQFVKKTRAQYEKSSGLNYDNPVHQLVMMGQYVKDRYGTPSKALAFWNKNHWY